jgi:alpha-glucosidase (family GH31 glycosyl hydrolase)
MFGGNLLVAPVTEKGAFVRPVYLPAGRWYDYWPEEKVSGSQRISAPCPLELIPLYVPAGGILAKASVVPYVEVKPLKDFSEIYLEVYTGANGQYTLYEDDGFSFGCQQGNYTVTEFFWDDHSGLLNGTGYSGLFPNGQRKIRAVLYPSGEERNFRIDYTSNRPV